MKKGFTIIEVSILFVIFLIVAFLVAPLSLDDTIQAKNIARWKNVQSDFMNIFYSIGLEENQVDNDFYKTFDSIIDNEVKTEIKPYRISALNNSSLDSDYIYKKFMLTYSNAIISYKFFESTREDGQVGTLIYDVNGNKGPNIWGKDVFGLNIYKDKFEPFGKNLSLQEQKQDCSKRGTGLYCSNYYLIGGDFE